MVLGDDFTVLINTWQADSQKRLSMLRAALSDGDASRLRETAHSLKGSSLNLGALRLGDCCLALESAARNGTLDQASVLLVAIETEYDAVAPLLIASLKG